VHVACTEFLTALHTGGRSAEDIDAGGILPRYHGTIVRDGYAGYDHLSRRGARLVRRAKIARDGLRLARRFRDHQDMILRFATDLAVGFTSNQAERDVRPVKVQQRTSGGAWRTLQGLADFAVVQSYLSTAAKWGIDALDALTQLFTTGPWLPAVIRPG
jgi:Transposase IS66 family